MITLISKNNCPQCKMTKRFLNEHNVAYDEHNINQEPDYIEKMHALGISAAPVVINGDDIFTGFKVPKLHQLIENLNQAE